MLPARTSATKADTSRLKLAAALAVVTTMSAAPALARDQPAQQASSTQQPAQAKASSMSDASGKADPQMKAVRLCPPERDGPFPVVAYSYGGGWVVANLDVYDAGPRALCKPTPSSSASTTARGRSTSSPPAYEDVYAATRRAMKNAADLNGDPTRVAVAGESAGGNTAAFAR
jgi:acetyl esterase/lipase